MKYPGTTLDLNNEVGTISTLQSPRNLVIGVWSPEDRIAWLRELMTDQAWGYKMENYP